MDDASAPLDRITPASGGTVEPTQRAAANKVKTPSPGIETSERFELRDPFAEVTYNARTLDEMVSKAEQLGAQRFVAIDANGQRSFVEQNGSEWQRRPVVMQAQEATPDTAQAQQAKPAPEMTKADSTKSPARAAKIDAPMSTAAITAAERAARITLLETALQERYIIKRAPLSVGDVTIGQTEYRFRGDSSRVAFTESTFRLATDTNSPSVARSMVDVAQARNWSALRVTGHEDFKRLVWLEASVRGVKAIGYEPNAADLDVLRREREARQVNRIEMVSSAAAPAASEKSSARGGGGRKAVLAAIEAVLVAKGVSQAHREAVIAAASEKLAERIRKGQTLKVKVYDQKAPSHQPAQLPPRDVSKTVDRLHPSR